MTAEQLLRESFVSLEVNDEFTEAKVWMRDQSKLHFCHRVGERWVRAAAAEDAGVLQTAAALLLVEISGFRLNAKHLEVKFKDAGQWEARFGK